MIVCGVPVAALATLLGGVEFVAIAGSFIVSLSLAVLGCVLALTISVWATRTHEVLMAVYMFLGLWLLSLPIWYGLSFGKKLTPPPAWFQKANPYVLVFAPYAKPGFARAGDYAVFGGVVLVVATLLAIVSIVKLRRVVVAQSSRGQQETRRRLDLKRLLPSGPARPWTAAPFCGVNGTITGRRGSRGGSGPLCSFSAGRCWRGGRTRRPTTGLAAEDQMASRSR